LKIVFNFHSRFCSLQEKDLEISSRITELQQEITSLKQQHQVEIWQLQERLKKSHGEAIIQKEVMQKQEVSALTQEWNKERQVGVSLKLFKSLEFYWLNLQSNLPMQSPVLKGHFYLVLS